MKMILIAAAALSMGGIALAQDAVQQPSGETVDDPSQASPPRGITQQGTDPQGQAVTPPGVNEGVQPAATVTDAGLTPRPATTEYPPCSRTVTDSCIQTYERGVRRARRR